MSQTQEKLSIGNCQCLDKFNKSFILLVLDKKIDDEKNNIKRVEHERKFYEERSKHSSQYYGADELISMYRQAITTTELVKKRIGNTQEC